jgi:putative DNA primase/helicase
MTIHTDASTIIRALGGNLETGMCQCPAHDDQTPSLKVSAGDNGKVLIKCFAGCTQESVIAALRERRLWNTGQRNAGPALEKRSGDRDGARDEMLRCHYAYNILRAAVKEEPPVAYLRGRGINLVPKCAMVLPPEESARHTGKRYPAMVCPITSPEGIIGTHVTLLSSDTTQKLAVRDGKPRRMYGRLRGGYVICRGCQRDEVLVIGEGIETTLSAMQISGLPGIAALSASNMPTVRPPECAEVVIAADNDDAGRRAAEQLARRLRHEGRRVRIAKPAAEGMDWNDRLLEGEEAAREEWRAALSTDDNNADASPISALVEDDFMALAFPERQLHLSPWLPRAGLVMIHAARGEGKTWFALSVGKAVANGRDFLGWSCPNAARVLYIDGELPGAFLQKRLKKFFPSPDGMFHVLCRDAFHMRGQVMPNLADADGRQEFDRIIDRCNPDIIIFDSISTLVRSGVENEAESWAPIQDWLLQHRWRGRTIILVHHQGRSGQPRGTSKREDVMDTMIGLRKVIDDDNVIGDDDSVFELKFTKARDFYGRDAEPLLLRLSMVDDRVS